MGLEESEKKKLEQRSIGPRLMGLGPERMSDLVNIHQCGHLPYTSKVRDLQKDDSPNREKDSAKSCDVP